MVNTEFTHRIIFISSIVYCVLSKVKATTEGVIQCKVDADCAVFTKLMKCVDKVCQCQMGYHLTNSLCGRYIESDNIVIINSLFYII